MELKSNINCKREEWKVTELISNINNRDISKDTDDFIYYLIENCDEEISELNKENLMLSCIRQNNLIKSIKLIDSKINMEYTEEKIINYIDRIDYYSSNNLFEIIEFFLDIVIKNNYKNIQHIIYLAHILDNLEYIIFDKIYDKYNKFFNYDKIFTLKTINEQIINYNLHSNNLKYIIDKFNIKLNTYNAHIYCTARNPLRFSEIMFLLNDCDIKKITEDTYNKILSSIRTGNNSIKNILDNCERLNNYAPDINEIPDNLHFINLDINDNFRLNDLDINIELEHIEDDNNILINNDKDIATIIKEEMNRL